MRVLAKKDHGDLMAVTCAIRVMLTMLKLGMRLLKKRTWSRGGDATTLSLLYV